MIALDMDGTLLDYSPEGPEPRVSPARTSRAARWTAGLNDMEQAGRRYYRWASWRVYTTAAARKPNPLMLRSVGATEYWGDSPEDAQAAANAGIRFVKVERFL